MKKSFLLLISLIFICGLSSVGYAAFDPIYFDFEDYTSGGVAPSGWDALLADKLAPVRIDDTHRTSLQITNAEGQLISYTLPEPVSEGKFLVSFDFYAKNVNVNMLTNIGTSSREENYYLFRLREGEFFSADTGLLAWRFTSILRWDVNTWYSVDMLLDMDAKKVGYYIDGELLAEEAIGFPDLSYIIFRGNAIEPDMHLCVDNFSFKYLSPGNFSALEEDGAMQEDNKTVNLVFTDFVDRSTLSNIKVFDLGSNPLAYEPTQIGYTIVSRAPKAVQIELDRPVGKNKMYKVSIDGVMSGFGLPYKNQNAYIATVGEKVEKQFIFANFANNDGSGITAPIKPVSDALWTKGGDEKVRFDSSEDPACVNFITYPSSATYRDNTTTLTRTFDTAYTSYAKMKFVIKSMQGRHSFTITDTEGNSAEVVKVEEGGIFVPESETAVGTITVGDWQTLVVEADLDAGTANLFLGTDLIAEDIDISAIADVKSVSFTNQNFVKEDTTEVKSHFYLASFELIGLSQTASITNISFDDVDGETIYPEEDIKTDVVRMSIKFSTDMDPTSFTGGAVTLLTDGNPETFSGRYVAATKTYVIELSNYLAGDSEYTLELQGLTSDDGLAMNNISASFDTQSGIMAAKNLSMVLTSTTAGISADIVHTDESYKDVYLVWTEYKDDVMINAEYQKITPANGERAISINTLSSPYTRTADADRTSVFIWDGFDTMIPLIRTIDGE